MSPEFISLVVAYFLCSARAETQMLGPDEARHCATTYASIKLELVPHSDRVAYAASSPAEQARIMREGYAAYRAWLSANPDLIRELQGQARAKAVTGKS